ncbi:diaminopimelate epimerase [Roseisolibacter agri]|uniref:Diaminopimelate epimerase n=1 Tax=Roseisolibacter agri TaxID=2014610 RepID=A0AA37QI07_9BACT|nr:diaminopimelate epimerase [Roseisolibacter agri]GLC27213.1 diaminopimelate epimerase [Roseisolibacter agri]
MTDHTGSNEEAGREFFKLCGSGNDFVFFDAREQPAGALAEPATIQRLCARATGIGADGVVFLEPSTVGDVRMAYYNSDGSRATLCGNATLCTTRLAVELGIVEPTGFVIETDAGPIRARLVHDRPEIEMPAVRELVADAPGIAAAAGEARIGFALAGVPHLVVRVADVAEVDLDARGRALRFDPTLAAGANVNFVSPSPAGDGWRMRTYERGVEGETLACGTGAVACAAMLAAWQDAERSAVIVTSSGRALEVRQPATAGVGPTLAGEGRIVFRGRLGDLG